jgi:hypothetical protein
MAIKCVHAAMTKDAMKKTGFRTAACDIAAGANKNVDEKQGPSAEEANLHAMVGMAQSEAGARKAVAKIVDEGRSDVIQAVLRGDYERALQRMGGTLHTVQDRAFHTFEPWLYNGLWDAIRKAPTI